MIYELENENYNLIRPLGQLINESFNTNNISQNEKILVYKLEDKIVGFLEYSIIYETIDIINIAVLEMYRRNKIATKLLNELLKIPSIEHIMLEVKVSNKSAIEFYKKNNFHILREIKNYYGSESAYSMERKIKWKIHIF